MKNILRISGAILLYLSIMLFNSCKKEEVPALTTTAINNLLGTSATGGGAITSEGTGTVLSRGVCWSTGTTPTIADNKTSDGAGAGSFTSSITGLNGATVYYVRAYATNGVGTGYGMAMSFTTLGTAPTPTGATATNITVTSARLNGTVNANYLSTVVTFEYGTTTSYGSTATPSQSPVTGNAVINVSSDITGLTAATIYHYRIKAINSLGTTYSNDLTFTTLGLVPSVTTLAATIITSTGAALNGTVNANYLSSVVTFEYGTTATYGTTITATQSPVSGNSVTNVSANITGLSAGTIYHFRVKAVNSLGSSNGGDLRFTTLGQVPTVTTVDATSITVTGATINGIVNANYLSTVVTFEYGTTSSYGNIATATQSPVTGNTVTNVSATITGLTAGTTYHYRIKGVNSLGTTYSNDMSFKTVPLTVNDVDGNTYNVIVIGTQIWMKENLKTTKYNDGTAIPNVTGNTTWEALITGAYSDYNNSPANSTTYGRLYNWYAVDNNTTTKAASNGGKNVCPTSWHVPTNTEWTTLTDYLISNGYGYMGSGSDIAKSMASTSGWTTDPTPGNIGNDQASNNSSGFTALPGGYRVSNGTYSQLGLGSASNWWSSSEMEPSYAYFWYLFYYRNYANVLYYNEAHGFSVRCLRD